MRCSLSEAPGSRGDVNEWRHVGAGDRLIGGSDGRSIACFAHTMYEPCGMVTRVERG